MEYNHNRFLSVRVGKQLSPQYWWQNHYPNLTLSTDSSDLPARVVPGGAHRRHWCKGRRRGLSASPSSASATSSMSPTTTSRATARPTCSDGKSWGARGQVRLPTGGALRRFDVAADIYRGHIGLGRQHARGRQRHRLRNASSKCRSFSCRQNGRGANRSSRRARDTTCSRPSVSTKTGSRSIALEQLESPRIQRAERRHLAGMNYRPYPQIAFKGGVVPVAAAGARFIHAEEGDEESKPFNGFARRRSSFSDVRWRVRFLTAALIVLLWTGHASTADQSVRRHREQGESGRRRCRMTELRRIFMKQSRMWPHGEPMVPVDWDSTQLRFVRCSRRR